jgi:predicted Zn-dependent protease
MLGHGAVRATGFSRDQEREADYFGLQYITAAGYRADAGSSFFKRVLGVEVGSGSSLSASFFADHPPTAERVVMLEKWAHPLRSVGTSEPLADTASSGAQPRSRPVLRMQRLQTLYDNGLVTKAEYEAKRRQILDAL